MFEQNNLGVRKRSPIITCIENEQNIRNMHLKDGSGNSEMLSEDIMSRLEPILAEIEENGLWDNTTGEEEEEEEEGDVENDVVSNAGDVDNQLKTDKDPTREGDATKHFQTIQTDENEEEISFETLHSCNDDSGNLNDDDKTLSIENEDENQEKFNVAIGDLQVYFPPLDGM